VCNQIRKPLIVFGFDGTGKARVLSQATYLVCTNGKLMLPDAIVSKSGLPNRCTPERQARCHPQRTPVSFSRNNRDPPNVIQRPLAMPGSGLSICHRNFKHSLINQTRASNSRDNTTMRPSFGRANRDLLPNASLRSLWSLGRGIVRACNRESCRATTRSTASAVRHRTAAIGK
jgi:hypothetical protein